MNPPLAYVLMKPQNLSIRLVLLGLAAFTVFTASPVWAGTLPTAKEMTEAFAREENSATRGGSDEDERGVGVVAKPSIAVSIHFAYDSTELVVAEEKQWLATTAAGVFKAPRFARHTFVIEGHSDARGSNSYNLDLSKRRAEAIRTLLIAAGVPPAQLRAEGKGKLELLTQGTTEADHQKNRRVVFLRE